MRCFKRPPTWASALALGAALCLAIPAHAARSRAVMVEGDRIVLGDISPTAPRSLLGVDVAPAPQPGRSTTVTRAAVQAALRRVGADTTLANTMPAQQRVTRSARILGPRELGRRVRASVASRLPNGVEIKDIVGLERQTLPLGDIRVEVRLGRLRRATQARVDVLVDDRVRATQRATLSLEGKPHAPALRADLPRGAVVAGSDVQLVPVGFERLPAGAVTRRADLVGKRLTQPGRAGRPIQRSAVKTPPAVERGAPVRIVAQSRGLRITRPAIAQEAGAIGDIIRVMPSGEKKVLRARVRSATTVAIELGGRR